MHMSQKKKRKKEKKKEDEVHVFTNHLPYTSGD